MTGSEDGSRLVARCSECEAVYAAFELSSGEIRPIGTRQGCSSCGGTMFEPISRSESEPDGVSSD